MQGDVIYRMGWAAHQQAAAARLYDEAFAQKFAVAMRCPAERLVLYQQCLAAEHAISASIGDELVGILGVHTVDGSLTGAITIRSLVRHLGLFKGAWAALVMAFYQRTPAPGELLIDGIAVDRHHQGHGIGRQLLARADDVARDKGCQRIRLDVIETNPHAKRLYLREGYTVVREESYPYLRWLLGFGGSTMMEKKIGPTDDR